MDQFRLLLSLKSMPPAAADDEEYGGNEPWNPDHTIALGKAWYGVSASPLGNGAGKKSVEFWVEILKVYHVKYAEISGTPGNTPRRGKKKYRPRTAAGLAKKWGQMLHDINQFLSCDIRATYVERRSGFDEEDMRNDARKFYVEKWGKTFTYEGAYNFLKGKKKWLHDTVQTARRDDQELKEGNGKRKRGGMGSRKVPSLRAAEDSGTEDSGEKVLGQKGARLVQKQIAANDALEAANNARIDAKVAEYKDTAALHRQSNDTEIFRIKSENIRSERLEAAEDNRVMVMDLTGLPAWKVEYFEARNRLAAERLLAKMAKDVTDLEDLRAAEEVARVAAAQGAAAAVLAAATAAADALAAAAAGATRAVAASSSPQSVTATDAADAADRANAARLVRAGVARNSAADMSSGTLAQPSAPRVELCEDEEGDDETLVDDDLLRFADMVEAFAATRRDDEEEVDTDVCLTDEAGRTIVPETQEEPVWRGYM